MPLSHLRRIRWGVRITLLLGVAASVAANVLHAVDNPISQGIAAWPPVALLLTVEMISRVPVHRRSLAAVRLVSTAGIAGIAAWVSYWHMVGVAGRYGESGASSFLLPLSVDGLVMVASVSLVELAGRIRVAELAKAERIQAELAAKAELATKAEIAAKEAFAAAQNTTGGNGRGGNRQPTRPTRPAPMTPPAAAPAATTGAGPAFAGRGLTSVANPTNTPNGRGTRSQPLRSAPARHELAASEEESAARSRRPAAETAALVAQIEAERPDVTLNELAAQLGISTSRLRAIRREAKGLEAVA